MAPAHAPLASSDELQLPGVALTYTTPTACSSVTIAPESELRELLLPSGFKDRLQVVKSDTKDNGCELRVELTSASVSEKKKGNDDVFEVVSAVDANMAALGKNAYLRSVLGWKELTLKEMTLQVENKRYDVLLNGTGGDKLALSSDMMLYGSKCSPQLLDEALVLRHIIPSGVDAGSMTIRKSDDVAIAEGHELDCAVVLGVTARAPLLLLGHTEDAMNYLKAFDANLDDTFEVSDKKRMVAIVQLYARESLDTTTELLTQDAVVTGDNGYSSYNAPSKEMAFGIFAGFFGLVAMLAAVVMKKKSHEKHCKERYANASKAAQLRRVSIRMASPSAAASHSAHRTRDDFGHEEEEEKEYEEHGEDDGLL